MKNLYKIISALLVTSVLSIQSYYPGYSQNTECIKTKIKPLAQNPVQIQSTPGNTNNDPTFENIENFADLNIPLQGEANILSTCIYKNNGARILNIDPVSGSLTLSESFGLTDNINQNDFGSTRGICTFSPNGDELFSLGIGPSESGFDRIYPYSVNKSTPSALNKIVINNINNFFIPSDLPTSIQVTPNGKFLVYLQADTSNNKLASIQSVEIKADMSLGRSFIGGDLARAVSAGSYLEYANSQSSKTNKFVFGVFSNLQLGKGGSGDSFAIFKSNQTNGANTILAEFKKDNPNFPLPDLFKTSFFGGFSGFKFVERNSDLYLFISYFEVDPNAGFQNFNYITKLAMFKVNIKSDLSKTASLTLIGTPITTVFKTPPCSKNIFHGISGPIWIVDNTLYIADNNSNENYFAAYFINWDLLSLNTSNTDIIKLASIPIRVNETTSERNTDIVVTPNNKYAYVVTSKTQDPPNTKIVGFNLEHLSLMCSLLKDNLIQNEICSQTIEQQAEGSTNPPLPPSPPSSTSNSAPLPPSSTSQAPFIPINVTVQPPPSPASSEFGSSPSRPPLILPPTSNTEPPKNVKPPKPPSSPDNTKPTSIETPNIQLIPTDTTIVNSDNSLNIDINSLDLTGEDQVIIPPTISHIISNIGPIELPLIEKNENGSKKIVLASETRGGVNAGSGGYLINLKKGITVKTKDLKNIIHIIIDKDKKITVIPAVTTIINPNKLNAKLSIPNTQKSSVVTLATILNKGGDKKNVIAKGSIKIFDSINFTNVGDEDTNINSLPVVNKIEGRVVGNSTHGGKIIRLVLSGSNFASRIIKIKEQFFISEPFKAHTFLSFVDGSNIEILRVRVLGKGKTILITLRFTGDDITSRRFTISTPKGQFFGNKMEIKLFSQRPVRSVTLDLDSEKKEKDKKEEK